jgi:hypothetical protein
MPAQDAVVGAAVVRRSWTLSLLVDEFTIESSRRTIRDQAAFYMTGDRRAASINAAGTFLSQSSRNRISTCLPRIPVALPCATWTYLRADLIARSEAMRVLS